MWESDPGYVTNIYLGGVHEEHLYVCLSIGGADEAARGGAAAATSNMVALDDRLSYTKCIVLYSILVSYCP